MEYSKILKMAKELDLSGNARLADEIERLMVKNSTTVDGRENPMAPYFRSPQPFTQYKFNGGITDPNWATSNQSQMNWDQMKQKLTEKGTQMQGLPDGDPRKIQLWKEYQWLLSQFANVNGGTTSVRSPRPPTTQ